MILYHCAPILLKPGSVILPGNFGRIIKAVGPSHSLWNREMTLEQIRSREFPMKPSRLSACFACASEEIARGYRVLMAARTKEIAWQALYSVNMVDPLAPRHCADYNTVEPLPQRTETPEEAARLYWSSKLWTTVADAPGLRCEEIVTYSALEVLSLLD